MVRDKLNVLKPNKSSGPDYINVNMLRQCPEFDISLSILFNKPLETGTIPQDWRDANVTPIFKNGSKAQCTNYRPISLTSKIAKLLERILSDKIQKLLTLNKFISCHQHGFQRNSSCITQLLERLNDWTQSYDEGKELTLYTLTFLRPLTSYLM